MKKILTLITILLCNISSAYANEIIHGIDVDQIYNSSDWSGKDKIKDIINDYGLLLHYKQNLALCAETEDKQTCMDTLAEKIIKHFYNHNLDKNLNDYHHYVQSVSAAYGVVYCLNKYQTPSGTMCNQETSGKTQAIVEQYLKDLLHPIEQTLLGYSFILSYKD